MAHLSRAASLRDLRARSLCRLPSRPGSALSWHNLSGPGGNRGGACVLHGCREAEELLAQLVRRELPLDEITPVPDPVNSLEAVTDWRDLADAADPATFASRWARLTSVVVAGTGSRTTFVTGVS